MGLRSEMTAWLILALHSIASRIDGLTDDHHLTTDPACAQYRAPRPGSRLDRYSRGASCTPCMVFAAYFPEPPRTPTEARGGQP